MFPQMTRKGNIQEKYIPNKNEIFLIKHWLQKFEFYITADAGPDTGRIIGTNKPSPPTHGDLGVGYN